MRLPLVTVHGRSRWRPVPTFGELSNVSSACHWPPTRGAGPVTTSTIIKPVAFLMIHITFCLIFFSFSLKVNFNNSKTDNIKSNKNVHDWKMILEITFFCSAIDLQMEHWRWNQSTCHVQSFCLGSCENKQCDSRVREHAQGRQLQRFGPHQV